MGADMIFTLIYLLLGGIGTYPLVYKLIVHPTPTRYAPLVAVCATLAVSLIWIMADLITVAIEVWAR